MIIYVIVSCPQAQGAIICIHIEICIFVNVIVFYFVFPAVFCIGGRAKFDNFFHFMALYMLVCVNKF